MNMTRLSKERFDALGGYCRQPPVVLYTEELAWFEYDDERLLGILIRDRVDSDFSCVVLGRDERGRYRFVNGTISKETQSEALRELERLFDEEGKRRPEKHFQGDEKGKKLDLFKVIAKNPAQEFLTLANDPKYFPARRLIEALITSQIIRSLLLRICRTMKFAIYLKCQENRCNAYSR